MFSACLYKPKNAFEMNVQLFTLTVMLCLPALKSV